MINKEIFDQQVKELASVEAMQFVVPPDQGYMLASIVQAAAMRLNLPDHTEDFCRGFVAGFCDRYRDQLPSVVKSLEEGWYEDMVTDEEFDHIFRDDEDDDLMSTPLEGDFLEENLDELEAIFAVAPPNHDPKNYDY